MNDLLVLAAIIVPPLLVTLAVFVDLRSRRGFGLVLVTLAFLGYCLWRIVPTEQALQQAPAGKPTLFQIALFFDFLICGYLTLLVWIGTVVEVSMARQMRWLAALVAEVVLAVVVVPAALLLRLEAPRFTFLGGAEALLALFAPMVTAFAYGVVRSARPTPRLEPETAPGELTPAAAGEVPQQSSGMRPRPAAEYQGSVIAVGILSAIVFLSVSLVIVLAVVGAIRTPMADDSCRNESGHHWTGPSRQAACQLVFGYTGFGGRYRRGTCNLGHSSAHPASTWEESARSWGVDRAADGCSGHSVSRRGHANLLLGDILEHQWKWLSFVELGSVGYQSRGGVHDRCSSHVS